MSTDPLKRIEDGINDLKRNRAFHSGFMLLMLASLAGWNIWCQSERDRERAERNVDMAALRREVSAMLAAQQLAFTDVLMRFKEDPKDQARFNKTMQDLTDYYRRKLNEPTD